jgi:hypothetical protein
MHEAMENLKLDPRADWLFSGDHKQVEREWHITGFENGRHVNVVIDRSFIDTNGVRWIVDFKFSRHQGADTESFLDNEQQRYCHQLEHYARITSAFGPEEVRLGLYFPLLKGWREWSPA